MPRPEEDIFSAVGGLELGADAELDSLGADLASTSGHEPHSEASRIIFVRGINANATDEDITTMFKVGRAGARTPCRGACARVTWHNDHACV